jgi:hypothetical protein
LPTFLIEPHPSMMEDDLAEIAGGFFGLLEESEDEEKAMQLRDRLSPHWPPAWGGALGPGQTGPTGEDGVLVGIRVQHDQQSGEDYLVLEDEYEGSRYSGVLNVPDPVVAPPGLGTPGSEQGTAHSGNRIAGCLI